MAKHAKVPTKIVFWIVLAKVNPINVKHADLCI